MPPSLPSSSFSFPNQRQSMPGHTKGGLSDAVALGGERLTASPLPPLGSTQHQGLWPRSHEDSLQSVDASFPPPRADLKLFLCMVFSPHINPTAVAHQHGVWTGATMPCCCLPNICWRYCTALLWSFSVPPTTLKQCVGTENPYNSEHGSFPMLLRPPRKRS